MTLHILNFITPLTPSRHTSSPGLNREVNTRKVDITAPGLRSVLNALVEASPTNIRGEDEEGDQDQRDLLVKVSPPIYIRLVLPPSMLSSSHGRSSSSSHSTSSHISHIFASKSTSELLESFMSTWTRLVGDPILSKWIVVALAISITLNGYLLKGISAGVVGGRNVESLGVGLSGVKGAVRFEEADSGADEDSEVEEEVIVRPETINVKPFPSGNVASFSMEDVDKKLQTARRLMIKPKAVVAPVIPADQPRTTGSSSSSLSSLTAVAQTPVPSFNKPISVPTSTRTLAECIDIFENGPRPLSESLALLNDEEIIMLAQDGKVAAYALEKVLGSAELERAVRIRRALICMFVLLFFWIQETDYLHSSCFAYPNLGIFRYPTNQLRLFSRSRRMLRKCCRICPSPLRNCWSSQD